MKIHILYSIQPGTYGGGNQFLKGLRGYLESESAYAETPKDADVLLFNSHQNIREAVRVKRRYPNKPFLHRIDGPMRLYNRMSDRRDIIVNAANHLIADGTIYQSAWSRDMNLSLGLIPTSFKTIIHNASDPDIFNNEGRSPLFSGDKVRLIAVSWSLNEKKGFDVYRWLDDNLDFDRYEMVFLGNSPVKFKNIKSIPPVDSNEVAQKFRDSDIYITGSQKDPCSNSLIEALNCGLPVVARNDGGHPEIIRTAGELFDEARNIPGLLDKIAANPENYFKNSSRPSIKEVGERYFDFAKLLMDAVKKGSYEPKILRCGNYLRLGWSVLSCKFF